MGRNVYVATDWHLWSTDPNKHHPYRTDSVIAEMFNTIAARVTSDDVFIFLGDLCDPEEMDRRGQRKTLQGLISSIRGHKVICLGNHDTMDISDYIDLGFDKVCDIAVCDRVIFSHKPVAVSPDEINVHGHIHTERRLGMGYQYINAYREFKEGPYALDELLDAAMKEAETEGKTTDQLASYVEQCVTDSTTQREMKIIDISELVNDESLTESTGANLQTDSILNALVDETLNEVIFEDPSDTEGWLQDDDYKPGSRKKEPMADGEGTPDDN